MQNQVQGTTRTTQNPYRSQNIVHHPHIQRQQIPAIPVRPVQYQTSNLVNPYPVTNLNPYTGISQRQHSQGNNNQSIINILDSTTLNRQRVLPVSIQMNLQYQPKPEGIDTNNLKNSEDFKNFLDNFADKDNYMCQICQNLLWDTTSCAKCQKNFCLQCVGVWLQNKNSCPVCREHFEIKKTDQAIFKNLNRLEFNCENKDCEEYPSYEYFVKHTSNCPHKIINCKHESCEFSAKRSEYNDHDKTCDFRPVECQWCKMVCKHKDLAQHEEDCDLRIIQCPNQGCDQKVPQIHLNTHQLECGYYKIQCSKCNQNYIQMDFSTHREECAFNEINCQGCDQQFFKKDINEHENQCPDILLPCEHCTQKIKRKDLPSHDEITCLRYSTQLLMKDRQYDETIRNKLSEENKQLTQKINRLEEMMEMLIKQNFGCVCNRDRRVELTKKR